MKIKEENIVQPSNTGKELITAEYGVTSTTHGDSEYYSLKELEQLEDDSMALIVNKFDNFRFRRNPIFKYKSNFNRFQREGSSSSNSTRGGYKTGTVDRSKIRCYKCNDMVHFATECKKARQVRNNFYDTTQKKKTRKTHVAE